MTAIICALLCIASTAVTAAFCMKTLPKHMGLLCLSALLMPMGQLAFALSIIWVMQTHEMAAAYLVGAFAANILGCAGIYTLAQGMAKTRSMAVNKELLCAAEEKAQAAAEYEALLLANTTELYALCDRFAAELESLQAAMGDGSAPADSIAATRPTIPDFAPVANALDELEETTRSSYCANQTANTILALKTRACSAAGVDFAFAGGMPQELAIDDLELCSVLSNLLDNAIKAASKAIGEQQPYVHVSCAVKGTYLVVKVTNSCPAAGSTLPGAVRRRKDKDPAREHGWGLEIVRDICTAHDGSFVLERTAPAEATATAILKVATV